MAHHLIMAIMNANTTHQKNVPKPYTLLKIHYHYFVSTVRRSASANWDSLHELICDLSSRGFLFDVIGLTEIFKFLTVHCISFNIRGYHCLQFQTRSDTDDGRGGIGLFINSKFTYVKRDDLSVFIPHVIESVFFEMQINERKTIIVGVVYRPNTQPRADIDIFMQKIIEIQSIIKEENKISYLMGDFNIDLLKGHCIEFKYYADGIHSGLTPPGNNS